MSSQRTTIEHAEQPFADVEPPASLLWAASVLGVAATCGAFAFHAFVRGTDEEPLLTIPSATAVGVAIAEWRAVVKRPDVAAALLGAAAALVAGPIAVAAATVAFAAGVAFIAVAHARWAARLKAHAASR